MPKGKFRGLPLSAGTPAPALIPLNGEQREIVPENPTGPHWSVANFMSAQGPAIAVIPQAPPESVTLVEEILIDGTPHLLLRLDFAEGSPVRYWPQTVDGLISEPQKTQQIAIEFGSHRAEVDESIPYTPWRGLQARYAMQSRMGTMEFKRRKARREDRRISEIEMQLSEEEKVRILPYFLARTEQINSGEMYHSVYRNCVTELRQLLMEVGAYNLQDKPAFKRWLETVIGWTPGGLLWSLRRSSCALN